MNEPAANEVDSDIDEKVIDLIDYDLRFVKFPQQFFVSEKLPTAGIKFSETIRNIKKEVLSFYREQDLRDVLLSKRDRTAFKRSKIVEKNESNKKLSDTEYRKAYMDRMKRLIF